MISDLSKIVGNNEEEIRVKRKKLAVDVGNSVLLNFSSRRIAMGRFYEILTRGFYGGIDEGSVKIKRDSYFKPDSIDNKNNLLFESKSSRVGGDTCNVIDEQMDRYERFQIENPNFKIFYVFYRHSFEKIGSYKNSEENLFSELCSKTLCSIVLPFSFVHKIWNPKNSAEFEDIIYRYDGSYYTPCSCLRSPLLNKLILFPRDVLNEVDMNDLEYQRNVSPRGFKINGSSVEQFPIIKFNDPNYKNFVEELIDNEIPF